jgi:hypothetical protein
MLQAEAQENPVVAYLTRMTTPKLRVYGFSVVSMNWPGAPGKNPGG